MWQFVRRQLGASARASARADASARQRIDLDKARFEFEQRKMRIDILKCEYQNRFDEVMFHSARYHRQVNFIQLYLTAAISFAAAMTSGVGQTLQNSLSAGTASVLEGVVISIAFLIALYLFTNVMDALYTIYMNGRQLAHLEQRINGLAESDLLSWDSEIIPRLYSVDKFFDGAWVRPNILMGLWSFLFFIGVSVGLCIAAYVVVPPFFYYFTPIALFLAAASVLNWMLLHREGLAFIDAAVMQSEPKANSISILYLIVIANLLLGYLPMVLLSVRDSAFWGTQYQFPFSSLVSVSIGDLLLLPMISYWAFLFLRKWAWSELRWPALFAVVLSAVVNLSLNASWISDQWTGFMDTSLGQLSGAGYVHLVYSFIHTTVYLLFAIVLGRSLAQKDPRLSAKNLAIARHGLAGLTAFLCLGIVDAVVTHIRLLGWAAPGLLQSVLSSAVLPLAALMMWCVAWRTSRREHVVQ